MLTVEQITDHEQDELDEMGDALVLQTAINAGQWALQGSYGRAMMDAIKSGQCALGRNSAHDYWGNFIPSRDMVKAGTPGSIEYVRQQMGDDWADRIEKVA